MTEEKMRRALEIEEDDRALDYGGPVRYRVLPNGPWRYTKTNAIDAALSPSTGVAGWRDIASYDPKEGREAMRFRKKPVVIEAWQHFADIGTHTAVIPAWIIDAIHGGVIRVDDAETLIQTLEGEMRVSDGDWIIRGIKGELYPCKPDIFAATYVPEQEGASEALPDRALARDTPLSTNAREEALEEAAKVAERFGEEVVCNLIAKAIRALLSTSSEK